MVLAVAGIRYFFKTDFIKDKVIISSPFVRKSIKDLQKSLKERWIENKIGKPAEQKTTNSFAQPA